MFCVYFVCGICLWDVAGSFGWFTGYDMLLNGVACYVVVSVCVLLLLVCDLRFGSDIA